jgi:arylsulfatase A-like enzyme
MHIPRLLICRWLVTTYAGVCLLGTVGLNAWAQSVERRPNIILILADDLGYGDLACYGNQKIKTPHIDSLATQGIRFTNAYVTGCSCSPSRAGLLSGCYQQRFGFEFNCTAVASRRSPQDVGLLPDVPTIANVLKNAGYATGVVGKWHIGFAAHHHPLARGFDEFFGFLPGAHQYFADAAQDGQRQGGEEGGASRQIMRGREVIVENDYLTDAFAREAVSFIDRHKAKPFFLYLPFNAVHLPLQASQKYLDRYSDVADVRQRTFNAMTSAMDDAIGRVLESLRIADLEANTMVVFLSDNGGPEYTMVQSNGPLRGGKLLLFEGGVRVPMLIRWPTKVRGGVEFSKMVSALDLLPTVAAVAGAAMPQTLSPDGINLVPYLEGNRTETPHEILFWRTGPNRAVRKGNWKLVQADKHVWLFDLAKDVGEKNNLANEHPEVVEELTAALDKWAGTLRQPAWSGRSGGTQDFDGVKYKVLF